MSEAVFPWPVPKVLVRSDGQAPTLASLRSAVWKVDPSLPLTGVMPLRERVAGSMAGPRFYAALLTGFGAVALLLAVAGVYGTVSYTAARWTRELGIRVALGADAPELRFPVVRRGMGGVVLGVVGGLAAAAYLSRFLGGWLYGVEPVDPGTFASVAAALLVFGALAGLLPSGGAGLPGGPAAGAAVRVAEVPAVRSFRAGERANGTVIDTVWEVPHERREGG